MTSDKRTLVANISPFGLRMQPDLKARMEKAAKASGRSLNAEIVARLEGVIDPDAEGWVRVWLPDDLIERIETAASSLGIPADGEIRLTLEEAYPPKPTVGDYVRGLRQTLEAAGEPFDAAMLGLVESSEHYIDNFPELAEKPLETPDRGYQTGPIE